MTKLTLSTTINRSPKKKHCSLWLVFILCLAVLLTPLQNSQNSVGEGSRVLPRRRSYQLADGVVADFGGIYVKGLQRSGTFLMSDILKSTKIHKAPCNNSETSLHATDPTNVKNSRFSPCWKHFRFYLDALDVRFDIVGYNSDYASALFQAELSYSPNITTVRRVHASTIHALDEAHHLQGSPATRYVVMVKNPTAWLISDMRYHKTKHENASIEIVVQNYMREWIRYVTYWLSIADSSPPGRVVIVAYEKLIMDPGATLRRMAFDLHLDQSRADLLANHGSWMMNDAEGIKVAQSGQKSVSYYRGRYMNCSYLDDLAPHLIVTANTALDMLGAGYLLSRLGYTETREGCYVV